MLVVARTPNIFPLQAVNASVSSRACHWKVDSPCHTTNFATLFEVARRASGGVTEGCRLEARSLFSSLGTCIKCITLDNVAALTLERMWNLLSHHPLQVSHTHCSGISTTRAFAHAMLVV